MPDPGPSTGCRSYCGDDRRPARLRTYAGGRSVPETDCYADVAFATMSDLPTRRFRM